MRRAFFIVGLFLAGLAGAAVLLTAGWQFWPGGAATQVSTLGAGRAGAALPADPDAWLISPTGGLVSSADVQDYLMQERLTASRALAVTLVAPLDDLLVEGEALPDPIYLEVMADIRAPVLAERLCPVLSQGLAERCAVAAAHVEKGSLDLSSSTAAFRLNIRYSQASDPDALPDLARYVFETRTIDLQPDAEGLPTSSVEAALQALLAAASAACLAEDAGQACRVMRLTLDYAPGRAPTGQAVIGSLYPLSETMRIAPELIPAPKI